MWPDRRYLECRPGILRLGTAFRQVQETDYDKPARCRNLTYHGFIVTTVSGRPLTNSSRPAD